MLFDGAFAARAWEAREPRALPRRLPERLGSHLGGRRRRDRHAALQLLALFQREGRFVDFLEQDVASFSDAEIGAVARVVHEGCRKALHEHAKLAPGARRGGGRQRDARRPASTRPR